MSRSRPSAATGAPSQRQLRVAEEVRHALSALFTRAEFRDPELAAAHVTVTEVRASPDLKHMTAFVSGLGHELPAAQMAALKRAAPFLRTQVAKAVRLKYAGWPTDTIEVVPEIDDSLDRALDRTPGSVFALPTYTALLELRNMLADRGLAPEYWR